MTPLRRSVIALGAALAFLTSPLPGRGAPPPRRIQLATHAGDPYSWGTFRSCLNVLEQWVGPSIPDWVVHTAPLSYTSRKPLYDPQGRPLLDGGGVQRCDPIPQSGRVFFPPAWRVRDRIRMPLVVYTHGTTLLKESVASEFAGHEWVLGAAAAAYYGFVVAMPDLPGLGEDSTEFHPFCHGQSLGHAVVDAIGPARELFARDPYAAASGYVWDGRVFLLGYSEGGYATLAAVKEMETHREDFGGEGGFQLAGSACMAGPFDVSGATRRRLLDPERPYHHAFFLPYVVLGYHAIYGNLLDPLEAFAPALMATGETGNILQWADGGTDGLVVDQRIAQRLGSDPDATLLRDILNPDWVSRAGLDDPAFDHSPLRDIFRENDLAPGWTPTRPILFCQSPDDEDVPLENTLGTLEILSQALVRAGRDPSSLLEYRPLGDPGCGIGHVMGMLLSMPVAFEWIYREAFPAGEAPEEWPQALPDSPFE